MEGRLRERIGQPSGELKWSVLRRAFAVGVVIAVACWWIIHTSQEVDLGERDFNSIPMAVVEERDLAPDKREAEKVLRAEDAPIAPTDAATQPVTASVDEPSVSVYLQELQRVETVPLETYVLGVIAAEMPLDFEPAALEAQAMAARTYIVRRLLANNRDGVPGSLAHVTDQVTHQAYLSQAKIAELRESNPQGVRKAEAAVSRTRDRIIIYEGEPIEALYFSASNGYTESSEEVFPSHVPYLRAVPSPWDDESRHSSEETVSISLREFYEKLDIDTLPVTNQGKPKIRVLEWTQGRRVKLVNIGSETITGEELRGRLGLRSAAFDIQAADGEVKITTHGSGHGVGMSQWGAEGMAIAGRGAEDIVKYYYTGVQIGIASKLLADAAISNTL